MSDKAPMWLRVGAGLGSAGALLVVLFVPAVLGLILFDTPETKLTDPQGYSIVPYAVSCFLFPVNAALYSWLHRVGLQRPLEPSRAALTYFGTVISGLMLFGMTGVYVFLLRGESGKVPFVVLVWLISVHFVGAVGSIFSLLALRRRRALTAPPAPGTSGPRA